MHNVLKQKLAKQLAQIANLMKGAFFVVAMSTCFAATSPQVEFCFSEIEDVTPTEIKEIKLKQLVEREKTVFASREEYVKYAIKNAKIADSIALARGLSNLQNKSFGVSSCAFSVGYLAFNHAAFAFIPK